MPAQPAYAQQAPQPAYAQPQAYPPQQAPAYPPQQQPQQFSPQAFPPQGAVPARKSSAALWLGIAGGVAVIGIIVAVVLATRGGDSDSDSKVADGSASTAGGGDVDKPNPVVGGVEAVDGYTAMLDKMAGFKNRACACKTKACIDTVSADMVTWSQDQAKNPPTNMGRVDEAAVKKMSTVMEGYTKCLTDVMIATAGGTPVPTTVEAPIAAAFAVGDRVMARWSNGSWYPGRIAAVRPDGTFDVAYDDGDRSKGLAAAKIRKQTASTAASTSKSTAKSSSRPASDAPCPGPGITRRCNGVCVNIQENNNHCGGCNNRCPDGKHCDGHLFCRDAEGNL
ncbi:MAG: hypothetical protein ABI867_36395 [Kofleriaceae bacterium]